MIEDNFKKLKESISAALQKPLPGNIAQYKMAPIGRENGLPKSNAINASVLILIYPKNDSFYTVFIKRNNYDGPHSGQISFPGGKFDDFLDDSLENTAIRETNEEIGTSLNFNDLIGSLSSLYIPVSKFNVYPFVAVVNSEPKFQIDPHEVQYTIEVLLKELIQETLIGSMDLEIATVKTNVPCFNIGNDQIWGATAMILNEFIEILKKEKDVLSSVL